MHQQLIHRLTQVETANLATLVEVTGATPTATALALKALIDQGLVRVISRPFRYALVRPEVPNA